MLAGLACAFVVGALVGIVTVAEQRLRVADDPRLAVIVTISGAIAGWAVVDGVLGVGTDYLGVSDAAGAFAGALLLGAASWHTRRETLRKHGEDRSQPTRGNGPVTGD